MNNETNTPSTMNKVTNLPKRYSWEYMYKVDGAIFIMQQGNLCTDDDKMWHLRGYASQEAFDNCEPFFESSSTLKRHWTHFMKYTFTREGWGL